MAPTASTTTSLPTLTQSGARIALQAAEQYALEIGIPMSIAVVDAHTQLLSFIRMDGANIASIAVAMGMASTAAGSIPTHVYQENPSPDSATLGIGNAIPGRFTILDGGVPVFSPTGDILGAIGCSNGTSAQDEAAANAGREAVLARTKKERQDEERRIHEDRQAVLLLWQEKEKEVVNLREELDGFERRSKRIRLSEEGSGSVLSTRGSPVGGAAPDTPPQEGETHPSFVGEVNIGNF